MRHELTLCLNAFTINYNTVLMWRYQFQTHVYQTKQQSDRDFVTYCRFVPKILQKVNYTPTISTGTIFLSQTRIMGLLWTNQDSKGSNVYN